MAKRRAGELRSRFDSAPRIGIAAGHLRAIAMAPTRLPHPANDNSTPGLVLRRRLLIGAACLSGLGALLVLQFLLD